MMNEGGWRNYDPMNGWHMLGVLLIFVLVFLIGVGAREIEQMLGIKMADAVGAVFILVLYVAAVAAMAVLALWTIAWIAAKIREAFKP